MLDRPTTNLEPEPVHTENITLNTNSQTNFNDEFGQSNDLNPDSLNETVTINDFPDNYQPDKESAESESLELDNIEPDSFSDFDSAGNSSDEDYFPDNESNTDSNSDDEPCNESRVTKNDKLSSSNDEIEKEVFKKPYSKTNNSDDKTAHSTGVISVKFSARNGKGNIIRDKKHCCLFCDKLLINLARHLENCHAEENDVAKLLVLPKKSTERRVGFIKIARKGDYFHNINILTKKQGELIIARRPSANQAKACTYKDYLPCPDCLAFMSKYQLWLHGRTGCFSELKLATDEVHRVKNNILTDSKNLLFGSLSENIPQSFYSSILINMRNDDVTDICMNDKTILKLGVSLYDKYGSTQKELIRQNMRRIARLLIKLNEIESLKKPLADWLRPSNFDLLITSVKLVTVFKENLTSRSEFKVPSLALKLGHSLRKCINIEKGASLRRNDNVRVKELKNLIALMDIEWADKISSSALSTLSNRKMNKDDLLPLTADLIKLNEYLKFEMEQLINQNFEIENWKRLSKILLARIILFNKRRSGEASKMTMQQFFDSRNKIPENDVIGSSLSVLEKNLFKQLHLVQIIGKRGRKVPVLLTKQMKEGIEVLIKNRPAMISIPEVNPFVFANASESGHYRGHEILKVFISEAGLKHPDSITSTNLRKYMATVCQVFNLTENETDWLARHLGHDIRVHRDFYRSHESVIELAKVSRLLLTVEKGQADKFKGKKLEDISINGLY